MREPEEVLLGDLRRLASVVDPAPQLTVHPSHQPEPPGTSLLPDCTACVVCCLVVAGTRGVLPAGIKPCRGQARVELRGER